MRSSTVSRMPSARRNLPERPTMAAPQTDSPLSLGEFALIDTLFAPLARDFAGAFDLKDDVAVLPPRAGHELVLKTDSLVERVHFLRGDPAGTVAPKGCRTELS